jgi:hypothetical protein
VPRVATLTPTEIEDILSHAFGHYAEQEMLRTYHQLLLEAGDAGAQWVAQFIDKPQTVTTSHRRLRQVAEERAPKIRGINKTTQEKLRKSLGLAAKETDEAALKKAARLAVTDVFEDALERRAPEISINETALGWGTGEYEQELEFGIPAHVWQTRGDEQVRESHAAMDGQCVSIDEPFISGDGNELQYPGDPSAPPSDTYNCVVHPNALVAVPGGYKRIDDMKPGDLVLTHYLRYRPVVRVRASAPYSGDLVTLRTIHGEICVTAAHPFLTRTGWHRADALKPGNEIAVALLAPDVERVDLLEHRLAHLAQARLAGIVPYINLRDNREEANELGESLLEVEVGKHQLGDGPSPAAVAVVPGDRQPSTVSLPRRDRRDVHVADPEPIANPVKHRGIAVDRQHSGFGDGSVVEVLPHGRSEGALPVEKASDVRHVSDRERALWLPIIDQVVHRTAAVRVYNFAVQEDESYIVNGFMSHNCRCEAIPLTGDCDSRSARHWTPARRKRYEKAAGAARRREERKLLVVARRIFRAQRARVREALERALRD